MNSSRWVHRCGTAVFDPNSFSFVATCCVVPTATDALVRTLRNPDISIFIFYTFISLKRPVSRHCRFKTALGNPQGPTYSSHASRFLYSLGSANLDLCSFGAIIVQIQLGFHKDRHLDSDPARVILQRFG